MLAMCGQSFLLVLICIYGVHKLYKPFFMMPLLNPVESILSMLFRRKEGDLLYMVAVRVSSTCTAVLRENWEEGDLFIGL